ncbi:kama family protein [Annulohypoxylon maeteangense]|uniref:kama family protein n=1 Tax=Annulohypoxylon maeteangense TaxID=1927788 RepID=UPI002008730A|nr:kama family protein [Annulohypoxylon maeteangense]KAI0882703.1 kama family protein [Annulohypoxylon maeteangense]
MLRQAITRSKGGLDALGTSTYPVRGVATSTSRHALETHNYHSVILDRSPIPYVASTPPLLWPERRQDTESDFWRKIPQWRDTPRDEFLSWTWGINHVIEANIKKKDKLKEFLYAMVPNELPRTHGLGGSQTRDEFVGDVVSGIRKATMSVRVMPYLLSRINWSDPVNDPIFKQFFPLGSVMVDDHPMVKMDSLNEKSDSPVDGLVHRYPDKALFLATSVCPTYCVFCTRAHDVGPDTEMISKGPARMSRERIDNVFKYIESQEGIHDIVVSGGDAFYIQPNLLEEIGDRLIAAKNIERFRFATKGLAVAPHRFLDRKDPWTDTLIRVSDKARRAGKHMALHTHFNHPNEISWITEQASLRLVQSGVSIRNQSVLLRGINDNIDTMLTLIKKLAKMVIQPYYIYQCDMVKKVEHRRTSLQTLLDIESQIQGAVAGFFIPKCIVDLPGGGGKRPASLYESYDRRTGISTFKQPALKEKGREDMVYRYYDPVDTLLHTQNPVLGRVR